MLFNVGEATTLPPVAASYQTKVDPVGAVEVAVKVCMGLNPHSVTSPPLKGAKIAELIEIVPVVLIIPHPPVKVTV